MVMGEIDRWRLCNESSFSGCYKSKILLTWYLLSSTDVVHGLSNRWIVTLVFPDAAVVAMVIVIVIPYNLREGTHSTV